MRIALHNFTGGEVSPILAARYDLSRYGSSVQCMENMLPGLHGDVRRRPGTLFLGSLEDEAVLLPFSFNALAEQNFVLVLSGNGLSIADIHGFDPQEGSIPRLSTPYEARHLLEICAAQVGDTVYLAHTAYPLHKLVRSTDSEPEAPLPENAIRSHGYRWTLEAVALNSSLPAPQAPICTFVRGNNDDDAGLGYTLRYKIVAVDANGKQSLASEAGSCDGKHPSDWVVGNRTDISWTAVEGATEYNIYREEVLRLHRRQQRHDIFGQQLSGRHRRYPARGLGPVRRRQQPVRGGLPPAAHGPGGYTRQPAGLLPFA